MRNFLHIISLLLAIFCLVACADNDGFTTSMDYRLSFSNDTLSLDTVFSNIPTASRSMWVYNKSGDGLRCSVKLEKGNTSAFRVNIDGIFLGEANNWQSSEIDIRNKDSVRIYVEATLPNAMGQDPQENDDNIVFNLESGAEQKVNLKAWAWNAELLQNGFEISKDTIIQSNTPILIYKGVKVDSGAVLNIKAGTTLYFHNDAGIDVYGSLRCNGTAENNVILRGDRIDKMFDYLPYDRTPGQWQGIRLHTSSYGNELYHTDIHSCFNGVVADSSDTSKKKLVMSHSTIHNCQGTGLEANNINASIVNSQITNTLGDCVNITGGDIAINSSTIAQFYPFDGMRGMALHVNINKNSKRLNVTNSLITGYADNVIIVSTDESNEGWQFSNCIIRTCKPTTADSTRMATVIFEDVKDTTSMGIKHFKNIDTNNLIYDFHLSDKSAAIDKADSATSPIDDHDSLKRDDKPDIGAYENTKKDTK
mgnify:CR=1 FL=1